MENKQKNSLVVFQNKKIRRVWHNDEWWFSVVDIISVLVVSSIPKRYWSDLKSNLKNEGVKLYDFIVQLKLLSLDNKYYNTDCVNIKNAFRLIQSIPSKKAEPFKQWLAKVGYERIQEIENPELAQKRMKAIYQAKGYSNEWIEKRVRGIAIRQELVDEWHKRNVTEKKDHLILTNEITKAAFGKTIEEYKQFKDLKNQNLRDHMDEMELILIMLGEHATKKFTLERGSQKFPGLKRDAKDGGDVAGATRKDIENRLGKKIVSNKNYLQISEKKRIKNKI